VYRLELSQTAHRQIMRLPQVTRDRVNGAIARLAENPRSQGCLNFTASEGCRLHVGDYRILYQGSGSEKRVIVYRVMSRGSVYRE
jgi:mRNA interferase RelE/StbE